MDTIETLSYVAGMTFLICFIAAVVLGALFGRDDYNG